MTAEESKRRRLLGLMRYEERKNIAHYLEKNSVNRVALAKELNTSTAFLGQVIAGQQHNPVILDKFVELGVPREILFDPRFDEREFKVVQV